MKQMIMIYRKSLLFFILLIFNIILRAQSAYPVQYSIPDTIRIQAGSNFTISVSFQVDEPWYIYAPTGNNAAQGMIETNIIYRLPAGFTRQGRMTLPETHYKGGFEVYDGKDIRLTQSVSTKIDLAPGEYKIPARISYQTCNEKICLPPKTDERVVVVVVGGSGVGSPESGVGGQESGVGGPKSGVGGEGFTGFSDFSFTAMDGKKVDLKDLRGKVVLIDCWATWCKPCIAEFGNLKKLYTKYHDQGFEVIGISMDEASAEKRVKDLVNQHALLWPQYFEGRGFDEHSLKKKLNIESLPTVFLLDRNGNILDRDARGERLDSLLSVLFPLTTQPDQKGADRPFFLSAPLVKDIYTADPAAHVFKDRIFIYGSHDTATGVPYDEPGKIFDMRDYHVLSMQNANAPVTDHGIALHLQNIPWASRQLWAPDAAAINGRYFLYFPAKDKQQIFRIGVAVSNDPQGPFTPEPEPIPGTYSIDPAVFKDDDGSHYLYFGGIWAGQLQNWSADNQYDSTAKRRSGDQVACLPRIARLAPDGKTLAEPVREIRLQDEDGNLFTEAQNHKRFFEAPFVFKKDGIYYFTYSTGDTHLICYATGDNPNGPFTYRGVLLNPVQGWTNHQSIVEKDGNWYLFYHDTELSGQMHLRNIKMTRLHFRENGNIETVTAYRPAEEQTTGIRFEKVPFSLQLEKARQTGKLIFIDAFTTWCGPCKWMDKNVFPDSTAGEYFNQNFVNAQWDMEKGEGLELRERYRVHSFPTYLFLDGDGNLVHRFVGSMPTEEFIKRSAVALDPENRYGSLLEEFQTGRNDSVFLYKFVYAARVAGDDSLARVAATRYRKQISDPLAAPNAKMIFDFLNDANGDDFEFIQKNQESFKIAVTDDRYNQKIGQLVYQEASRRAGLYGKKIEAKKVPKLVRKAGKYFKKTWPQEADMLTHRFTIQARVAAQDANGYADEMIRWQDLHPITGADELNQLAWNFYENVSGITQLEKALAWARESIRLKSGYANNDTEAALLSKLGRKEEARLAAQRAIELGKKEGADVSATQKLLEQINAK